MLLMNLILTELGVCLYGIPVDLVATMQGGWGMGEGLCTATGFILTVLGRYSNIMLGMRGCQWGQRTSRITHYWLYMSTLSIFSIYYVLNLSSLLQFVLFLVLTRKPMSAVLQY